MYVIWKMSNPNLLFPLTRYMHIYGGQQLPFVKIILNWKSSESKCRIIFCFIELEIDSFFMLFSTQKQNIFIMKWK